MKRTLAFISALVIASGLLLPVHASAQDAGSKQDASYHREKSLGLIGGYNTYNESGYAGVNFQYEFAPHFRLSPSLGYSIKHHDKSALLIDVDMQFPFRVLRGFSIYPLAGVTFNNWTLSKPDHNRNLCRFGGNLGGGFDIYFTSYFKMEIQAKYSWMQDTSGGFFGLGFYYMF